MRRWVAAALVVLVVALGVVFSGVLTDVELEPGVERAGTSTRTVVQSGFGSAVARAKAQTDASAPKLETPSRFALQPEADPLPVEHEFGDPPRAGVLFDLDTGEVLWERHLDRELPIASLTKMMTAWVIASRHKPGERVLISRDAVRTGGSMVGVLPKGKLVPLGALMEGLLLVSGNDAATALAEHDAGTVDRFVARMNEEARRLGMSCTRFTSPHGLQDKGNHSCPRDLALLARADLSEPWIAEVAGTEHSRRPFPMEGGFLDLYNINPFIEDGSSYTGLKTGYTDAAGRCYVVTAKRGGRELGVVLLDSPNPLEQVPKLLELGAKA